jgi:fructose-1,6-bisphosphatase II
LIFAATGISDSPMLPGIHNEDHHVVTHSILMRAKNRTVRRIEAFHDLSRKTIRMHSTGGETPL